MKSFKFLIIISLLICKILSSQEKANKLTLEDLKPHTTHFKLTDDLQIPEKVASLLNSQLSNVQFVGMAEVHQSKQLSYFTTALLDLLKENGFRHFALELGPYSAKVLHEVSISPEETQSKINLLNRKYGKNNFPKIPLIFVDKIEDTFFVEKASELGYSFWGLDQEFAYSFEMHFDRLYAMEKNKTPEITDLYNKSKSIIRKVIFKNKISGNTKNCWLQDESTFQQFFNTLKNNKEAQKYINALLESWDIYCKQETGKGGSQQRANHMKSNFNDKYKEAKQKELSPKVFLKFGGVHLTHGISVFGIDDIGHHIHKIAKKNNTEFLVFRHLRRFKKGKDLIRDKNWKRVSFFMGLGLRDKWTLIDLRPLRSLIKQGKVADKSIAFEIRSYDYILISPDDKNGTLNY